MRAYIFSLLLFMVGQLAHGQNYEPQDTLLLNGNGMQVRWADWQGDNSPDLLVSVESTDGTLSVVLLGIQDNQWQLIPLNLVVASPTFEVADMDNDGQLDLIAFLAHDEDSVLSVLLQRPAGFDTIPLGPWEEITAIAVDDITSNGLRDVIVSGKQQNVWENAVYLQEDNSFNRTTFLPGNSYAFLGTGYLSSARNKQVILGGTPGLHSAIFSGNSLIIDTLNSDSISVLALSDQKPDNYYEFIYSMGSSDSIFWRREVTDTIQYEGIDSVRHIMADTLLFLEEATKTMYSADLNADGITDIWHQKNNGEHILWQGNGPGNFTRHLQWTQPAEHIAFGDWENDGDLDLALLSSIDKNLLYLFMNVADTNEAPEIVGEHVVFQDGEEIIIGWSDSNDDHSAPQFLTYDLIIGTSLGKADTQSGGFDLSYGRRMSWIPGNAGTRDYQFINGLDPGLYYYAIQSMDNSFYPIYEEGNGDCLLACAYGAFLVTDTDPEVTKIPFCDQDSVTIGSQSRSGWYSRAHGFLGFSNSVTIPAIAGDRIFQQEIKYSTTCDPEPGQQIVYELTKDENISVNHSLYACVNETTRLEVFPTGDSTRWTSSVIPGVGEGPVFELPVTTSDTVVATTYFNGCIKTNTFFIQPSIPEVIASPASAVIFKGTSIALEATGAETFTWSPPDHLDNPLIAGPVATPPESIEYLVVGRDSLGCLDSAMVRLEVMDQAFIPNLFTPNGDQQNDQLLIYGLSSVKDFEFIVYNRNGAEVYRTKDPSVMTQSGWDGTRNGNPQPDGVYYWKVKGRYMNNDPVVLSGKVEGVVHLMR